MNNVIKNLCRKTGLLLLWMFFVALFSFLFFFVAPATSKNISTQDFDSLSALPLRLSIPSQGISVSIENPVEQNIAVLDQALTRGAVRYPHSPLLGEDGNMLIFGHTSHLPVVYNQNYKAFNGINHLKTGAQIIISSQTHVYEYSVKRVSLSKVEDSYIDFSEKDIDLTLVTCNSLGDKNDRYIVEGVLIKVYPKN